ncbi:MAG: hypothetical protein M3384_02630 [Acidobacteriota bacterium]|nr:hypothetical protein [Acidobacteriota bacterium]
MKNQKTGKFLTRSIFFASLFAAIAFLALNLGGATTLAAHDGDDEAAGCNRDCRKSLAAARAATAKYHNFDKAVEDGFVQVSPCVEVPGLGAMGFHYVNFQRAGNPNLDAAEPEVLLYLPDRNGKLHLVGLEYVRFASPASPAPTLFGQEFHYDQNLGAYTLHVWAWRNNPSGMFAPFNSQLSCPAN